MSLAVYSYEQRWDPRNLQEPLEHLMLPSDVVHNPERWQTFLEQRKRLQNLRITDDIELTYFGSICIKWIGQSVELNYAVQLQRAIYNIDDQLVLFWLVVTAASTVGISELLKPGAKFQPLTRTQYGYIGTALYSESELYSIYKLVCDFLSTRGGGRYLYGLKSLRRKAIRHIVQECELMGLDARKIVSLLDLFYSTFQVYAEINHPRLQVTSLPHNFEAIVWWPLIGVDLTDEDLLNRYINDLGGRNKAVAINGEHGWEWRLLDKDLYIPVSATPLKLQAGAHYTGKLTPRLDSTGDTVWSFEHVHAEEE